MQLFLGIIFYLIFELSVFAVNILLPLSISFAVVGKAVANKMILKAGFVSSLSVIILSVVILAIQLTRVVSSGATMADIFGSSQGIIGFLLPIFLPILVSATALVVANKAHKNL